jgi:quercetin dioxygenase-like cupin family protein
MFSNRDILVAGAAAVATISVVAVAAHTNKPAALTSSVFDWEKIAAAATKYGAKREVVKAPTATLDQLDIHITTVNPGQRAHDPHRHPDEEIIIVKEGTIESMQEGATTKLGPGSIIFEASNQLHGVANAGDTPATYFVIKFWPPGTLVEKSN